MRTIKKQSIFLFIVCCSILQLGFAQYSPTKVYKQHPLTYDTTTHLYKTAYQPKAPKGAPNIVLIMLDDVGFGLAGTFGGLAETRTMDQLAAEGLKYNNFHTTALCASSRAALLTGRNHHSVNMGHFTETAFDAPGYDGNMPFEKATMAEVFKENGYNSFILGKWHLTPLADRTAAGPFNRWPTGRGFDRFYGFLESATDQYYPVLWEGITKAVVDTAAGKHLNTILADKAIQYIQQQQKAVPGKPFLLYLAPGTVHSPMQVGKEWIDQYKGKFDMGWDEYRAAVLARQKILGVVPAYVTLPARNEKIPAWESLSKDEKKVMARAMEAHAGFLSQADDEIGRVINYIKQIGQIENTIVIVIIGDNGATKYTADIPGVPDGMEKASHEEKVKAALKNIEQIGRKNFKGDIPLGWTQATNVPFKLWKGDANAEGGTHNPMIIYAPKYIKEKGGIRNQYVHLIDIWPTLIELTNVKVPLTINGYKQAPIEGNSFGYSLNDASAKSNHSIQYFETGASRALYKDGWKAEAYHPLGTSYKNDVWELYNIEHDFNERINLAKKYPQKLNELKKAFEIEAKKYHVYPLHDSWFPSNQYLQISDSRAKEANRD
jgi:arylsulfatase A-like enzyme